MKEDSRLFLLTTRLVLARKIYEKCIELFASQANLAFKMEPRVKPKSKGGKDKLEVKFAKAVKLLLVVTSSLSEIYRRLGQLEIALEALVLGIWFGKRFLPANDNFFTQYKETKREVDM